MPVTGLEPVRLSSTGLKSVVYANSTTPAKLNYIAGLGASQTSVPEHSLILVTNRRCNLMLAPVTTTVQQPLSAVRLTGEIVGFPIANSQFLAHQLFVAGLFLGVLNYGKH